MDPESTTDFTGREALNTTHAELNGETIARFDRDIKALLQRYPRCVIAAALFPQKRDSGQVSEFDPFGERGDPTGIYATNQLRGDSESMASLSAYLQVVALKGMYREASYSPVGRDEFLEMARFQREHMVAELARQMVANGEDESC